MILGITGTNGAGKGAVVEYLVEKGFTHYSVRDAITQEIERRGLPLDRSTLNEVGTDVRRTHGPDYFARHFMELAKANAVTDAVIESIRNPKEADYIKDHGGLIIVVNADEHIRFERIMARKSQTDLVTFEQFKEQEAREMKSEDPMDPNYMDIQAVIEKADATIVNEGTLEELGENIDKVLASLR